MNVLEDVMFLAGLILPTLCSVHPSTILRNLKEVEKASQVSTPLSEKGHVVFYDDFSSGIINSSKWTYDVSADGVGHNEFQMYSPDPLNSYVKDRVLYLRPTLTVDRFGPDFLWNGTLDVRVYGQCTNAWCVAEGWNTKQTNSSTYSRIHPVMSAYLRSSGHIRYGRVEVVAQLPKGDWLWPAIWLMPRDSVYGPWPRSGEIDIMEAAGNRQLYIANGSSIGVDLDRSTLHYGPDQATQVSNHADVHCGNCSFGDDFHTYWLDWTKDYIKIGVDNRTTQLDTTPPEGYWKQGGWHGNNIWAKGGKNAPFDQPFYLILNVAVGGNFFSDGSENRPYPKPWNSTDPEQMQKFWNARHLWWATWNGENCAMKVKSVRMLQY